MGMPDAIKSLFRDCPHPCNRDAKIARGRLFRNYLVANDSLGRRARWEALIEKAEREETAALANPTAISPPSPTLGRRAKVRARWEAIREEAAREEAAALANPTAISPPSPTFVAEDVECSIGVSSSSVEQTLLPDTNDVDCDTTCNRHLNVEKRNRSS